MKCLVCGYEMEYNVASKCNACKHCNIFAINDKYMYFEHANRQSIISREFIPESVINGMVEYYKKVYQDSLTVTFEFTIPTTLPCPGIQYTCNSEDAHIITCILTDMNIEYKHINGRLTIECSDSIFRHYIIEIFNCVRNILIMGKK